MLISFDHNRGSIVKEEYLDRLKILDHLKLPKDQYLIWGSGPLAIRGLRAAQDIDLVVSKPLWKDLSQSYPVSGPKKNRINIGELDIWSDLLNLSDRIEEVIQDSDIIEGYPFMKLSYTVEWKTHWNSAKDPKDIALIEKYLQQNKMQETI